MQKLYNPEMSKAFPPQKASEFFTGLAAQFGNIEKFDGPTGNGYRGWIAFRLHCQRGELTMSLALDANDKISGIYFQPAPRPPVNFKSFVLRTFQLAASGLDRAFLSGRVVLFLAAAENNRESRGDQHSGGSFA